MNTITKLIHIIGLCSLLLIVGCAPQATVNTTVTTTTTVTPPAQGSVVMVVSDAAANMGSVSSVVIAVDSVDAHSQQGGWVALPLAAQSYDLLALKASGKSAILVNERTAPVHYDQVRMHVTSVTVIDANGTHSATMPSGEVLVNAEVIVASNATSTAAFDFKTDQSLYTTKSGSYVFAPVVNVQTRTNVAVDASTPTNVQLVGGLVVTDSNLGMDVEGHLVIGGHLPPFLTIDANNRIVGTEAIAAPPLPDPNAGVDLNSRVN